MHYSVVTRAELFAGSSATEPAATLLGPFRELAVDREVAERAGRIRREHGLALSTRNVRDFRPVRGLRLRALR